jgi:hypothetical protein
VTSARGDSLLPVVPGLLLALLSCWCGTLPGGATAAGSIVGITAILSLALLGVPHWSDPLQLGRRLGLVLPLGLVTATLISWASSPVSRSGQLGVLLLPAILLAPAGVARCWQDPRRLQIGLETLSLVIVVVSGWSLVDWWRLDTPRAAMPLGHHNLLAGWLVFLLPFAAVGLRRSGARRWLAATALLVGTGAILATGSALGLTALILQGTLAALWWPSLRIPFAAITVLAGLSQLPRVLRILSATDVSTKARLLYLHAAWDGVLERPAFGWGPGSTPWLIAGFLEPDPTVNPPSQVVGDLHSLPAQLAFELGLVGLAMGSGLWLLFVVRRWIEREEAGNKPELLAPLIALGGGTLFLLGNAPFTVLALPVAIILTCGAALAAGPGLDQARGSRPRLLFTLLYLLPVGVLLLPMILAQVHYDRAATAESSIQSLDEIDLARSLDPSFPLYGARTAWLKGSLHGVDDDSARLALHSAESAMGVAPLWLAAGSMGLEVSADWTLDALSTASNLDPLSPLPHLLMALSQPQHPEAGRWAAQALRLEPRLSRTSRFLDNPDLIQRTTEVLEASGQDGDLLASLRTETSALPPGAALGLTMDREPALAFSLYGFRRRPWPATLVRLPLRH